MRNWTLALLLVAAACGKKGSSDKGTATAGSGTASGSAAAGRAAGSGAAGSAVAGSAVAGSAASGPPTLATGEPTLGCFAWSARLGAAACLTGSRGTAGDEVSLVYVGDITPLVDVDGEVTAEVAARANRILTKGGYQRLPAPTEMTAGKPMVIEGVTVTWDSVETAPPGNNRAPTRREEVQVHCPDGEDVTLFDDEAEGYSAAVSVYGLGGSILVEYKIDVALEGEYGKTMGAAVVKAATCELALVQ